MNANGPSSDLAILAQSGLAALRRGDAAQARDVFDTIERSGHGTHQLRLLLAQACAMVGDAVVGHRALDLVLAHEPGNVYALVLRGDLLCHAGDLRAATSWYRAALSHASMLADPAPELAAMLRRAQTAIDLASASFADHLETHLDAAGIDPAARGDRFKEALDILSGRSEPQLQRPTSFYYPGLAPRAFFDRAAFDWVTELEAEAPAIRAELVPLLADEHAAAPYVVAEADRPSKRHPLMDDPRWSALHLYRAGEIVTATASRCPATMAALTDLPLPRIEGRSPMALFSVLRAGTHIPPHHGMLNTRLICHLPLVVPPSCRLRVGNETRTVEQDRMIIFDDTIEHEAWNDGPSTRVVLLFEIWRPDIEAAERQALTILYEAISRFAPADEDQAGA